MPKDPTGQILRKARLIRGLSQMQVANLAGINLAQYQRLEYGRFSLIFLGFRASIAV